MRSLHLSWSDQKPFKRRVRWYQGTDITDIRLNFADEDGEANWFYTDREEAKKDFQSFKEGTLTSLIVLSRRK